jgi:holin-like protein
VTRVRDALRLLLGLAILAGIFVACDALARATKLPLPGNVIGMGVLFALLLTDIVPRRLVDDGADLLLKHLSLLFVPAAVAVARHRRLLGDSFVALAIAVVVSTVLVLLVTGLIAERLVRAEPASRPPRSSASSDEDDAP